MNSSAPHPHRRRLTRAEVRRRRRSRVIRRVAGLTVMLCVAAGGVTFLLSFVGVKVGNVFGLKYKNKAEMVGGAILILMGLKILLEHLGIF